ncbi:FAD-dependent oxidoreductase, partial [Staphylococcus saprophyticus]
MERDLKWGGEKDVMRLIGGLENVEIVRYGVMDGKTLIN